MSDFIRKHGRPDINCMKNGSQGSCCFLLLNREEVSPGKKKKKSMVFLYWSDGRGDVGAHGVWVTSRVGDSSLASSCLYSTQTLAPFRSEF